MRILLVTLRVIFYIFIILIFFSVFLNYKFPCQNPLQYSIGNIDKKFNLENDKVFKTILKSVNIWENASKKDLFQYNKNALLKINFIFDQRQQNKIDANLEKVKINTASQRLTEKKEEYKKLIKQHSAQVILYENAVETYNQKQREYKNKIKKWNAQGGAPKKIYDKLIEEKISLQRNYSDLESKRKLLNDLIEKLNSLANNENTLVNQYNDEVAKFNKEFGKEREFDQGEYFDNNINIYYYNNDGDLTLVVTHELGHALNLDHVQNKKSIMYYLLKDQDLKDIKPTEEDLEELNKVCNFKTQIKFERLLNILDKIRINKLARRIMVWIQNFNISVSGVQQNSL